MENPARPVELIAVPVVVLEEGPEWTFIESPIEPGNRVVARGAGRLALAAQGASQAGGHFHADGLIPRRGTLMLTALVSVCVRHATAVVVLALGLLAVALGALARLPVDVFPDLEGTRVTVMTEAPGLATNEVERLVTIAGGARHAGRPRRGSSALVQRQRPVDHLHRLRGWRAHRGRPSAGRRAADHRLPRSPAGPRPGHGSRGLPHR